MKRERDAANAHVDVNAVNKQNCVEDFAGSLINV